jgi:hypothetical protein
MPMMKAKIRQMIFACLLIDASFRIREGVVEQRSCFHA